MAGRITLPLLYAAYPSGTSPTISVFNHGTQTLATLYTDKTAITTAANPFTPDQLGDAMFFAADGDYDVAISVGNSTDLITVTAVTGGGAVIQALAPAAGALAIDARKGSVAVVSPTGNVTPLTVTNLIVGQRFILDFISDGTHTMAYPTVCKFAGGAAGTPTTTSGQRDRYEFLWDGTNLIEVSRSLAIH